MTYGGVLPRLGSAYVSSGGHGGRSSPVRPRALRAGEIGPVAGFSAPPQRYRRSPLRWPDGPTE